MNNQLLTLKQLDRQLKEWQTLGQKYSRPKAGWVKTVRNALGMTTQQLAERMGLARGRIVQLENAEKNDAVTLRSLKKAAEAMNCELIYAIVPKKSLFRIIQIRAGEVAEETVEYVSHSMALEKQSIAKQKQQEQKEELTKKLLEGSLKKIWRK